MINRWKLLRRFVILLLVAGLVNMLAFVQGSHLSHDAASAEAARHVVLKPVDTVDHSHSHDDGEDQEQWAGHTHGHDPADHSHQVAFVSHHTADALQKLDVIRFVEITDLVNLYVGSGLERPPKGNVRI